MHGECYQCLNNFKKNFVLTLKRRALNDILVETQSNLSFLLCY